MLKFDPYCKVCITEINFCHPTLFSNKLHNSFNCFPSERKSFQGNHWNFSDSVWLLAPPSHLGQRKMLEINSPSSWVDSMIAFLLKSSSMCSSINFSSSLEKYKGFKCLLWSMSPLTSIGHPKIIWIMFGSFVNLYHCETNKLTWPPTGMCGNGLLTLFISFSFDCCSFFLFEGSAGHCGNCWNGENCCCISCGGNLLPHGQNWNCGILGLEIKKEDCMERSSLVLWFFLGWFGYSQVGESIIFLNCFVMFFQVITEKQRSHFFGLYLPILLQMVPACISDLNVFSDCTGRRPFPAFFNPQLHLFEDFRNI